MYNEELETLIDAALADGELTEKEKQVLFKRAQAEGIDLDEFEMILDARLVKFKKSQKDNSEKAAPQSNKLGDVKKCPACGALVPPFHASCPDCGFQFNDLGASQVVEKFVEKLNSMEENRNLSVVETNPKKDRPVLTFFKYLYFGIFIIPVKLFKLLFTIIKTNMGSKPTEWDNTDRIKEEYIMNFPIPIAFSEVVEFLLLAKSKIKNLKFFDLISRRSAYDLAWNKVWMDKTEQIVSKAKIAMASDKAMLNQVMEVSSETKANYEKICKNSKIIAYVGVGIVVAIITLIIVLLATAG